MTNMRHSAHSWHLTILSKRDVDIFTRHSGCLMMKMFMMMIMMMMMEMKILMTTTILMLMLLMTNCIHFENDDADDAELTVSTGQTFGMTVLFSL